MNRDADGSLHDRARRDERIRRALGPVAPPVQRLRTWLDHVDSEGESLENAADRALAMVTTVLLSLGMLFGATTAAGVFYYDGSGRVNVLAVMGVLVCFPAVLLFLSWAAALNGPRIAAVPLVGDLLGAVGRVSPGRFARVISRICPEDQRLILNVLLGFDSNAHPSLGPVRRWLAARWSHLSGLGFFSGALATILALVLFTDIAFGWSSTLTVSSDRIHGVAKTLAIPWGNLIPDAVPTLELVQATRYFRSGEITSPVVDPVLLGQWWSFLVLSLIVYGLVPRAASVLVARWLLSRAVSRTFVHHPQSEAVLERLTGGSVDGHASDPEEESPASWPESVPREWPEIRASDHVVNWSSVPIVDETLAAEFGTATILHAGGEHSLEDDAALIDRLATSRAGAVTVVCKAWEPPVLDLTDFLDAVAAGGAATVRVVPVRVDHGTPIRAQPRDRIVWQRAFASSPHSLASPPGKGMTH